MRYLISYLILNNLEVILYQEDIIYLMIKIIYIIFYMLELINVWIRLIFKALLMNFLKYKLLYFYVLLYIFLV